MKPQRDGKHDGYVQELRWRRCNKSCSLFRRGNLQMTGYLKPVNSVVLILFQWNQRSSPLKDELFPEELCERCVCFWMCLTGQGPSFVGTSMSRAATLCCEYIKKPIPNKRWVVTRGLLRLSVAVGLSAQSSLRRVGSAQQADSVPRYLNLKASLLVSLTEITVWVLWRQVSRRVGFYSRGQEQENP